jgi:hypothetical protein
MAESLINPLPLYLREAFHQAVTNYWGWERGAPEPEVSLQQRPHVRSAPCHSNEF